MKKVILIFLLLSNILYSNSLVKKRIINFGFHVDGILMSSEKEVKIPLQMWVNKFIHIKNSYITVTTYTYVDKILNDFLDKKTLTMIGFNSITYLKNKNKLKNQFQEMFMFVNSKEKYLQYYLISNKDELIQTLEKKSVVIKKGDLAAKMWLEYLLHKKYKIKKHYFETFDKEISVDKQSKTVLNLFFGKADYTVVTKYIWDTITAIKAKIKVVEKSPKIFTTFIGILSKEIDEDVVYSLKQSIKSMIEGQPVLNLLKVKKVLNIEESYLDDLDTFYNEYQNLEKDLHED